MNVNGHQPAAGEVEADVEVVVARTPLQVEAAYDVRTTVFVDEQGVPPELELDEDDDRAVHLLATRRGKPVGAARLVGEAPGYGGADPTLGDVGHLGRLAVLPAARGAGLGVALVRGVEDAARAQGLRVVVLSAQSPAVGFYERLGYTAYGDEFEDAGLPHRMMSKPLTD